MKNPPVREKNSVIGARRIALRTSIVAVVAALAGTTMVQACGALGVGDGSNDSAVKTSTHNATQERRQGAGRVSLVAAPVAQTRTGRAGVTPGSATFRPAVPGRVVLIQGKFGKRWKTVSKVKQDRRGEVTFTVTKPSISYRAVAPATKKDAKVVTAVARSTNWGTPTWRDEFSGSGPLNPAIWATQYTSGVKFACGPVKASNARRQHGAAVLKVARLPGAKGAKTKKCKYGKYSNALVQANNPEHQIKYGIAAARVKFSPVNGQHSAFWMDVPAGTGWTPGDPAGGAEIDIAEYFGDDRPKGGLASFVHVMDKKGKIKSVGGEFRSRHMLPKKKEWSQGWHVYSVEWTPTGYTFRVDGKVTLKTGKSVSRVPETILLSAITSDWELPQMNAKRLPTVTKFDWVRVWQRPGV